MNMLLRPATALLKRFGASAIKKAIWDQEFRDGKWDYLERTSGKKERDILFAIIEKYCNGGKILDLGCGTGKVSTFLDIEKYRLYVGVDISDAAIHAARLDCASDPATAHKKIFIAWDIKYYLPDALFDVIVFVESLYYINRGSIPKILDRYSRHLTDRGVIVVRVYSRRKYQALLDLIHRHYAVIEEHTTSGGRCSIVFRKSMTGLR